MAVVGTVTGNVLAYLRRHPDDPQTVGEVAEALRMRTAQVRDALVALEKVGQVRKLGAASSGGRCWAATDTAREQP